jgi:hypothetical protein
MIGLGGTGRNGEVFVLTMGESMRQGLILAVMLATAAPVQGDQATLAAPPSARFGTLRPAQTQDPYRQLFAAQQALKSALEQAKAATSKPTVVCGMLMVPADPKIDPKMAVTPPQNPNLEYKIRVFEPPVCRPSR